MWNRFIASGLFLFSSGSKAFKILRLREYIKRGLMVHHLFLEKHVCPHL